MNTLQVSTDKDTWVNLVTELSLISGTSYIFQNTSPVVTLLTEKTTTPDDNTPYHTLLPGLKTRILVDTSVGIWVKSYKDSKGKITVSVTESYTPLDRFQTQLRQGKAFFTNYNFDAGLNVETELLMISPVTELVIYLEDFITSTLGSRFEIFIGNTITLPGTEIPGQLKNPAVPRTPVLKLYHTPTISVYGPQVYTTQWGSGNKAGGLRQGSGAIIISNLDVLFRITSLAATNNITHELHWTEDTN